jgi:hypothetical protein
MPKNPQVGARRDDNLVEELEMSDNLTVYLQDHLAGSHFAVNLLQSLTEQYKDEELGAFALGLSDEIKQDQATLQRIADNVGKASIDLTQAVGWLGEKASKFKLLRDDSGGGIGTFEALETLALGIRGKYELWQVLPVICEMDERVPAQDFENLTARALDQYKLVEQHRLQMARTTFRPTPK